MLHEAQVQPVSTGLFRSPDGAAVPVPALPALDLSALEQRAVDTLRTHGERYGLAFVGTPAAGSSSALTWTRGVPAPLQPLLAADPPSATALALRIDLGWCPADDGFALCVRAEDAALGDGRSGVRGVALAHRRQTRRGTWRARYRGLTVVERRYRYRCVGAVCGDLPSPTPSASADLQGDAALVVERAAVDWLRAAVGRRAVRRAPAPAPPAPRASERDTPVP